MTTRRKHRDGMAMVLVTVAITMAVVLGTAMLAASSLQVQCGRNTSSAVGALGMAESGVQMSAYYLLYPLRAPSVGAGGYWTGGQGLSLGSSVPGTVDVSIVNSSKGYYDVTATGWWGANATQRLSRSVQARLKVDPGLQITQAAAFSGNSTVPACVTVNGNVQVNGKLTNQGHIYGTAYSTSLHSDAGSLLHNWVALSGANQQPVTSPGNLQDYRTYNYNGWRYTAGTIASSSLSTGTILGPTTANPGGVYYRSGDLTLSSNVTINGTLIVDNGSLTVNGSNCAITAASGLPGLVVKSDVILKGAAMTRSLSVDGVTWLGGSLKSSGSIWFASCTFNGAIIFGGNNSDVDNGYTGSVTVNWDATKVYVPELDKTIDPPGVMIVTWK